MKTRFGRPTRCFDVHAPAACLPRSHRHRTACASVPASASDPKWPLPARFVHVRADQTRASGTSASRAPATGQRIICGTVTAHQEAPTSRLRAIFTDAERVAVAAFVLVEIVGFCVYVVAARKIWFFRDDWDFLAGRTLNVSDLLRQHGGHLVALPLVVFRAMYLVIGLRSYLPYQVLPIVLHLTAAALLRVVMRRAGVNPWIATVAASLFALFGAGSQDILWAFQITFSGPLVFGLAQLLLSDHDGPVDRRDWIALGFGFAGLLCSGVAIAMIGVVALATLVKRGWRVALFQALPLAIVYLAWYLHYAGAQARVSSVTTLYDWLRIGIEGTFDALGQVPFVGWGLAIMLVAGLVLAWRQYGRDERRRRGAIVGSMLVGAFAFMLISGINRAGFGTQLASSSRYLHIMAALMLPSIAVAADAIARRGRAFIPLVIALLVVGVPGNIAAIGDSFSPHRFFADYEETMRSLPRAPLAAQCAGRCPARTRQRSGDLDRMAAGCRSLGPASGAAPTDVARSDDERASSLARATRRRSGNELRNALRTGAARSTARRLVRRPGHDPRGARRPVDRNLLPSRDLRRDVLHRSARPHGPQRHRRTVHDSGHGDQGNAL